MDCNEKLASPSLKDASRSTKIHLKSRYWVILLRRNLMTKKMRPNTQSLRKRILEVPFGFRAKKFFDVFLYGLSNRSRSILHIESGVLDSTAGIIVPWFLQKLWSTPIADLRRRGGWGLGFKPLFRERNNEKEGEKEKDDFYGFIAATLSMWS